MNPRIYAFSDANKAIVIRNNLKEKDLRDKKLKKLRQMKLCSVIGCFLGDTIRSLQKNN